MLAVSVADEFQEQSFVSDKQQHRHAKEHFSSYQIPHTWVIGWLTYLSTLPTVESMQLKQQLLPSMLTLLTCPSN